MQHDTSTAEQRATCFAKLMTFNEQQVLTYLRRDENDKLAIVVQLWVAHTDEQLGAVIAAETDEETSAAFQSINDESMPLLLEALGIPQLIAMVEEQVNG